MFFKGDPLAEMMSIRLPSLDESCSGLPATVGGSTSSSGPVDPPPADAGPPPSGAASGDAPPPEDGEEGEEGDPGDLGWLPPPGADLKAAAKTSIIF